LHRHATPTPTHPPLTQQHQKQDHKTNREDQAARATETNFNYTTVAKEAGINLGIYLLPTRVTHPPNKINCPFLPLPEL